MAWNLTNPFVALGLMALAMAFMPLNDAAIKLMGAELSLLQIVFLRSVLILAVLLIFPVTWRSFGGLSPGVWALLLMRGSLIALAMVIYFVGLAFMGLWQATALFFVAPLLISLLSVPLLGERLGVWRILAQIMGFGGILMIAIPGSEGGFDLIFVLPLLAALYYALYNIMTRLMGDQASTLAMTNIQHLAYMLVGLVLALIVYAMPFERFSETTLGAEMSFVLRDWTWPRLQYWLWMGGCGVLIGFLSFAAANAYSNLEASTVAPMEYAYIPLSLFWSAVIFQDWPDLWGWAGCALILGAGLLTLFRENIKDVDVATAAPMPMAASSANLEPDYETASSPISL